MIKNMHPADELAMVRADIERLKSREAFLRRGFLEDTLPRHGAEAVVEIAVFRSRRFLPDKLPPSVLEDEAYWGNQRTEQVRIRPR
tara:strand:- start:1789 stop:2046 length:258 start_codon:yes stop_codon:yes gene_type:complete